MEQTTGASAVGSGGAVRTVSNLWRFRMLARTLARHHLILKYRNSILGFVWTLLAPLAGMGVLVLVFSLVVRIEIERYWAFLLSGYFVWVFFQNVVGSATGVFRDYSGLRRSVAFPNEVAVLGVLGARMTELLAEFVLIVIVLVAFHHGSVPASLVMLPVLVVLLAALVAGLAVPTATLSILVSDIEHAVPIVLGLLFYLSPVFYPASMVPEHLRPFYLANPIAGLLTMFHTVLYEGRFPSWTLLAATAATTAAAVVIGWAVLGRFRDVLPEVG